MNKPELKYIVDNVISSLVARSNAIVSVVPGITLHGVPVFADGKWYQFYLEEK